MARFHGVKHRRRFIPAAELRNAQADVELLDEQPVLEPEPAAPVRDALERQTIQPSEEGSPVPQSPPELRGVPGLLT